MRRSLCGVLIAVVVAQLSALSAASQGPADPAGSAGQAARAGAPAFDVTEKSVVELQEAMARGVVKR